MAMKKALSMILFCTSGYIFSLETIFEGMIWTGKSPQETVLNNAIQPYSSINRIYSYKSGTTQYFVPVTYKSELKNNINFFYTIFEKLDSVTNDIITSPTSNLKSEIQFYIKIVSTNDPEKPMTDEQHKAIFSNSTLIGEAFDTKEYKHCYILIQKNNSFSANSLIDGLNALLIASLGELL